PMATMEEALVPLYMYHRYAVESAATAIGGQDYIYAFRGDDRIPTKWVSAAQQRAALTALVTTLSPAELALPKNALMKIPPGSSGGGRHRRRLAHGLGHQALPRAAARADHDAVAARRAPGRADRRRSRHGLARPGRLVHVGGRRDAGDTLI